MLYDFYMKTLYRLERIDEDDPEGGMKTTWETSGMFEGALVELNSNLWPMGDSDRLSDQYKLYTSRATKMDFHEVFRDGEGTTFRVISSPRQTPQGFTDMDLKSCKVERWDLE